MFVACMQVAIELRLPIIPWDNLSSFSAKAVQSDNTTPTEILFWYRHCKVMLYGVID